jgi:prophage regulatory protein
MVPLADTTIYEMEQRGEFPRRFYLTPRCAAWDAAEIENWIEERRQASGVRLINQVPRPDVRKRTRRPVKR